MSILSRERNAEFGGFGGCLDNIPRLARYQAFPDALQEQEPQTRFRNYPYFKKYFKKFHFLFDSLLHA